MLITVNKLNTKMKIVVTRDDSEIDRKEWCMEATSFLMLHNLRFAENVNPFWVPQAGRHSFDIESGGK